MMYFRAGFLTLLLALSSGLPLAQGALTGLTPVATSLSAPIFVTHPPGDPTRLFIAQRSGAIRILDLTTPTPTLLATPYMTMTGLDTAGEGGFLGMAFHPNYATNGKFYTYVTRDIGSTTIPFQTRIEEYQVTANPNVADPTVRNILRFDQPQDNHNGGWIGFGPNDGYLYIASGDGGNGDDLGTGHTAGIGNAQDTTSNLLGKMLRIDVNGDDFTTDPNRNYAIPPTNPFVSGPNAAGDDEIWSYGLRNPFRASFDTANGNLWIGDVGQNTREEIDFQPASSGGGENYGWRLREGLIATPSGGVGGAKPAGAIDPVLDYQHGSAANQGNSVTGGVIYRGPDPALRGRYFYGDAISDNIWMFDPASPTTTNTRLNTSPLNVSNTTVGQIVAFGSDATGQMYMVNIFGTVFRFTTNHVSTADYSRNGVVDAADYSFWATNFGGLTATAAAADASNNGIVDAADYTIWRDRLPPAAASVPEPATGLLALLGLLGALQFKRNRQG